MAEDRPLLQPEEAIAALRAELEDRFSTLNARAGRLPTGTGPLPTQAATAPPGTVLLDGSTLQRADYPDLWAWVQRSGAIYPGGYGAGNGTTTFTVPNLAGLTLVGAGQLGTDTYVLGVTVGTARHTLSTGEMPSHGHTGTAASAGTHSHTGSAATTGSHVHDTSNGQLSNAGGHGGHFPGSQFNAAAGADLGLAAWNSGGGTRGDHGHFFTLDINSGGSHSHNLSLNDAGAHTHNVTVGNTGDGQAHENRQPSRAVNWLVWT